MQTGTIIPLESHIEVGGNMRKKPLSDNYSCQLSMKFINHFLKLMGLTLQHAD